MRRSLALTAAFPKMPKQRGQGGNPLAPFKHEAQLSTGEGARFVKVETVWIEIC